MVKWEEIYQLSVIKLIDINFFFYIHTYIHTFIITILQYITLIHLSLPRLFYFLHCFSSARKTSLCFAAPYQAVLGSKNQCLLAMMYIFVLYSLRNVFSIYERKYSMKANLLMENMWEFSI